MAHSLKRVLRAPTTTKDPLVSKTSTAPLSGASHAPDAGAAIRQLGMTETLDPERTVVSSPDARMERGRWLRVKRALDVLAALSLLVVASPLLILVSIAIAVTSRGPVLFQQERIGSTSRVRDTIKTWELKPFTIYKFRTMYVGQDDAPHRTLAEAYVRGDQLTVTSLSRSPGVFKLLEDPRITPVGALLRRFSIDELPQLINVIKGDMSMIGPRPPLQYEVDNYAPWHMARFQAKPGITGLWQVMGRSSLTFEEMIQLDNQYAQHQSFAMDLKILLKTFGAVISGRGAA